MSSSAATFSSTKYHPVRPDHPVRPERVRLLNDTVPPVAAVAADRAAASSSRPATTQVRHLRLSAEITRHDVIYWMSRDQRVQQNWAATHARALARARGGRLHVAFSLVPTFLGATHRAYAFMLGGLREVESELRDLSVPFHLLNGQAVDTIPELARKCHAAAVVTDFSPLRVPTKWASDVGTALEGMGVPLHQVDAHNAVPCWHASPKRETAARTFRPKITKLLPTFMESIPPLQGNKMVDNSISSSVAAVKEEEEGGGDTHQHQGQQKGQQKGQQQQQQQQQQQPKCLPSSLIQPPPTPPDWEAIDASLECDRSVGPVAWAKPGTSAGLAEARRFGAERLSRFGTHRNDPNVDALSNLSPWIHFGQIYVPHVVQMLRAEFKGAAGLPSFAEESIVRRELADNYCFYEPQYDSLDAAAGWARQSLELHAKDPREHVYTRTQLEHAQTHDDLWNASQRQLVLEGKMHGFLRMYWAKKILEWTPDPATALSDAIYLNDRFSLDGRDPNGYTGVGWSIFGLHDMGWKERPIFGKIRYMNYKGCLRKFKVKEFVAKYPPGAASSPHAAAPVGAGSKRAAGGPLDKFFSVKKEKKKKNRPSSGGGGGGNKT